MNTSNLSELEQLKRQVTSLKSSLDILDDKQCLAIISAVQFLTFLKRLYGND